MCIGYISLYMHRRSVFKAYYAEAYLYFLKAIVVRLKPTYIFKSYSSLGLTRKTTFNNGFDLLDNGHRRSVV